MELLAELDAMRHYDTETGKMKLQTRTLSPTAVQKLIKDATSPNTDPMVSTAVNWKAFKELLKDKNIPIIRKDLPKKKKKRKATSNRKTKQHGKGKNSPSNNKIAIEGDLSKWIRLP